MRIAAVSKVETVLDYDRAAAEFRLSSASLQAWTLILVSLAAIAGLLLPVVLITADAVWNPQVFDTLSEHPGSAALLSIGLIVGLGLMTYPLRAGLERLGGETRVIVADGHVEVERRGILRPNRWRVPLAEFCGVTHHIRATLSGARHEIILVHTDPAKDVLLQLTPRHPQEGADYFAHLLGLPEVQPRTLYGQRRAAVEQPVLQAQAA